MANKPYALVPYKYLEDNFIKKGQNSWVGTRVFDESLDTQAKVKEKYGGTYWKLLSHKYGVYQWLRTDAPSPQSAYLGYVVNTTDRSISNDTLIDLYGGVTWQLSSDEVGVYTWICTDYAGGEEKVLPAYVGMIISSPNLPDALSVNEKYGGAWLLLSNEGGIYQWECSAHDTPASSIPSQVGDIIASSSLTSVSQVATLYGGTWELLSDEENVYQYERVS